MNMQNPIVLSHILNAQEALSKLTFAAAQPVRSEDTVELIEVIRHEVEVIEAAMAD